MSTTGIYLQVPFCQTKCTYCNFHTGVVSAGRYAPYAAGVAREVQHHRSWWKANHIALQFVPHQVDTLYIGGGTPSLLEPELLAQMFHAVRHEFSCELKEVTLEADPETIEPAKAAAWAAMGINRISLGTQSFLDDELKAAGRMHRREDIYRAVPILRKAGIRNISFDLIAGLPKQTPASWATSLRELIEFSPEHVSVYMMEIDEGSRLGLEVLQSGARYSARELPSEDDMAAFYKLAQSELKCAGYIHYEISNWAKPGMESLHNLKYWRREPYLGFGAGAHSFSGQQRWANLHDAASYVQRIELGEAALQGVETVSQEMALEEELFLGLRQLNGISIAHIEERHGISLSKKVLELESLGMLKRHDQYVRLAPDQLNVSNEIIVELLREAETAHSAAHPATKAHTTAGDSK